MAIQVRVFGESIVVGVGLTLCFGKLDLMAPTIISSACIFVRNFIEYITGWEPLKLKLIAGPGWVNRLC